MAVDDGDVLCDSYEIALFTFFRRRVRTRW